ncbi:MAG: hypothetical protein WKH64_11465 [Chloroflexia bacterium]
MAPTSMNVYLNVIIPNVPPVGEGSSRKLLFQDTFYWGGGSRVFGFPPNAAHWWEGMVIQDFSGGSNGRTALIHDEGDDSPTYTVRVHAVSGAILAKYSSIDSTTRARLGSPTSNQYAGANGPRSNFDGGWLETTSGGVTVNWWPTCQPEEWTANYRQLSSRTVDPPHIKDGPTYRQCQSRQTTGVQFDEVYSDTYTGANGLVGNYYTLQAQRLWKPAPGDYRIRLTCDDGCLLFVDGVQVAGAWVRQSPTEYFADVNVSSAQAASGRILRLHYYERTSASTLKMTIEAAPTLTPPDSQSASEGTAQDFALGSFTQADQAARGRWMWIGETDLPIPRSMLLPQGRWATAHTPTRTTEPITLR